MGTAKSKNNNNSAPGRDKIVYPFIKNLPESSLNILLNIFNQIWDKRSIPMRGKSTSLYLF